MNTDDIQFFERLIERMLLDLDHQSADGKDAQSIVQLDQQAIGRLSRMDALQNQAMAKAQQVRRDTERVRLKAALVRLRDGEFGYCEDCGEQIVRGRLELDPAADKCVSCASG